MTVAREVTSLEQKEKQTEGKGQLLVYQLEDSCDRPADLQGFLILSGDYRV